MSARLNKKRKGRGTQINRERTVTTLTDGSEGSFMAAEDPQLSSPFSVASSSNGPTTTISPSFSMSSGFQYGYVPGTVIQSSVHGQSAQPAHFYSAQSLPPGRNDLEILERLKETIKNNQHELFTPVPRPSALASVYLGPHNGSQVPPHPEQIPRDYPSHHHDGRHARASSTASSSDARKVAPGAGSSQTSNNMNLSSGLSLESIDSGNKSTDMDPPGLNTPLRSADSSQRTPRLEHAPVGTAGKYDARGFNRSGTEKSLGEVSPSKGDINIKEEPRNDRDTDWARRDAVLSQDAKASRYDRDSRYDSNGRPVGDARYGNNDNTRPSPRYTRGDYDRDKSRERDRDRDLDRNREHRRYEPNRFNDRRNDDRFRSTDNRRPPPDQRHYEPDYSSRNDASLGRWDSKSSVDSAPSPATRPLDARSSETRGPRSLAQERSFDSRDGRPPVEDRSYNERVSRPLAQERSFESRGPGPLSSERSFDQRGPRPLPADEDRSGKPPVNDDRRSYLPSSSDRTVRSGDNARGPAPASPSKPVIDDRRPVNTLPATRPLDDRKAPLSQPLSSSSVGADHRPPPPPLTADRQRPLDSGSDRAVKYPEDYPPRQRSVSVVRNARTSSPVRPPPPESDRNGSSRPQLPLEDRISRPTSLQDRLGSRPTDGPPPRQEDKGSHPAHPVEQRSSVPSHAPEPVNKPTVDPPLNGVQSNAPRNIGSDTSRPPPPATRDPPRPAAQTISPARRSTGPPAQRLSYPGNAPVAPQAEEILKPRGTTPPRRAEYRPLDRSSYPDRYERDASREQRPDALDVTSSRFSERAAPQTYNRPSPPAYSRPEPRDWQPSREQHSYPRHSHDPTPAHATYEREWRGDERPPYDAAWEQRNRDRERTLEPGHEFGRDSRYYVGSWDPIRDRERYPPEEPPAARPYDNRLPPRDLQRYPESHTYERARYPESPPPVGAPRVRPRSPSPARRTGIADLQPPLKRARDDGYSASFYPPPPPPSRDIPREYSAPASSVYYDDLPPSAGPVAPAGDRRDRSYRERDYLPPYDARHAPAYSRDDRRYG